MPGSWASRLPAFPWDSLLEAKETAGRHPGGLVDLSIGTPVDRVPHAVRAALAAHSDFPGYPTTQGTLALRQSYSRWLSRTHEVPDLDPAAVLPTIGSKELVAGLPFQLGLGATDTVAIPELAYPTYEVGVRLAGCQLVRTDHPLQSGSTHLSLLWLNSPSNPTGAVLSAEQLRKIVIWARANNTIVASDECYIDLGWDASPVSILNPAVSGGNHTGLLALHSLSKRSNLAGYRIGFVSGDPSLIDQLLQVRKHMGLMMPGPMQAAAIAALDDDGHVMAERSRYSQRRTVLTDALTEAGFQIDHSEAGLYLWCTRGKDAEATVSWFADRGILVASGAFYGPDGASHVRVSLTAADERVAAAAERLSG
ncbi:MAG: succinyldiaminopimelate transaminase [Nakamurella sp.]